MLAGWLPDCGHGRGGAAPVVLPHLQRHVRDRGDRRCRRHRRAGPRRRRSRPLAGATRARRAGRSRRCTTTPAASTGPWSAGVTSAAPARGTTCSTTSRPGCATPSRPTGPTRWRCTWPAARPSTPPAAGPPSASSPCSARASATPPPPSTRRASRWWPSWWPAGRASPRSGTRSARRCWCCSAPTRWCRTATPTPCPIRSPGCASSRPGAAAVWVLDPRRTETARLADHHLQLRPESDWLVLGWLVRRLLSDPARRADAAARATGVDELFAALAVFDDVEMVSRLTGLAVDDLEALLGGGRRCRPGERAHRHGHVDDGHRQRHRAAAVGAARRHRLLRPARRHVVQPRLPAAARPARLAGVRRRARARPAQPPRAAPPLRRVALRRPGRARSRRATSRRCSSSAATRSPPSPTRPAPGRRWRRSTRSS